MADERDGGRHTLDVVMGEGRGRARRTIAWTLVWGGRLVPLVALALVAWCRATASSWHAAPVDDSGFTTALLPNATMVALFLAGFALPFVVFPVASTALVERAGDTLTGLTALGRRQVGLKEARVWHAVLPGRGWGAQLLVLRGVSPHGLLVLLTSEVWLAEDSRRIGSGSGVPRWRLLARGWVLILALAAGVLVVMSVGMIAAGL